MLKMMKNGLTIKDIVRSAKQVSLNESVINDAINKAKPATLKGQYLKSITVAPTMGPGVTLNVVKLAN